MKISITWINELVPIENIQLESLVEKLTLGGFEVEEILEFKQDNQTEITLDISATANRSDSLSIQGISTEIAALLNKTNSYSNHLIKSNNIKEKILGRAQKLEAKSNCSMLLAVSLENLTNKTIPEWIKKKLIKSDIIPSNTLKDFQSYILLETGYPFAFYDFDKIIKKSKNSEIELFLVKSDNINFIATNFEEYQLTDSNLVIKANEIPISIAGIIENNEFIYSESTTSLLIEASIFDAATIRRQSRKLGIRTERSTRYEKSLKKTYLIESLYRLISLLRIANPNLKIKFHTIKQASETVNQAIKLKYQTIKEILGPIKRLSEANFEYIQIKTIEEYLTRLNFVFSYDNREHSWDIIVPESRSEDLKREIDLVEEIGRLHGFNNFLITLPKLESVGIEDNSYKTRKKLTSCLLGLGFTELINYSLVNDNTFLENKVQLVNPLVSEYATLRFSLLPNLIKNVEENLKQSNSIINGFEYGHVFSLDKDNNFKERECIAGIFGGSKTKLTWSETERELSWFEAKGQIEQLFNQLNLDIMWENNFSNSFMNIIHSYRSAEIYLNSGLKIGNFGQIHPFLANNLNISKEIYLFEFDFEIINDALKSNKLSVYSDYSTYPKIIKDISFIVKQDIKFSKLQEIIYLNGTKFLCEVKLIDEYKGHSIPDNYTSLCLQLTFQSDNKTLQNKEIEDILTNIRFVLIEQFNATIRT